VSLCCSFAFRLEHVATVQRTELWSTMSLNAGETRDSAASSGGIVRHSFDVKKFLPERVGVEINNRYEIDANEFARGGYGKVYVAKERVSGQQVAIKEVLIRDPKQKEALQREAQIMKDLDHPNICKLLEIYDQGNLLFYVMELCEGGEVFARIRDEGMISEAITVDIIAQVASALKYTHQHGIAHRDIKPENLLFCSKDREDHTVKVIDWGLGAYFDHKRMSSSVGSPQYAAPEVLRLERKEYTSAVDLWSLGVVTYVMLCGKPPFWGNQRDQLVRMKAERYPMSGELWDSVSVDAKDFIGQLLKYKPSTRLPIDQVLEHPWLKQRPEDKMNPEVTREVLANMKAFSQSTQLYSVCIASVAKQLDHRSLRSIHQIFRELDTNGDGVLDSNEVRIGFERIYGANSTELAEFTEMFERLDLDGSGTIDYTEFCAASIGERVGMQEHVLWSAFKAFDIHGDDAKISKAELQAILQNSDVKQVLSEEAIEATARELMENYDENHDGFIDFNEYMKMMRQSTTKAQEEASTTDSTADPALVRSLAEAETAGDVDKAYALLCDVNHVEQKKATLLEPPQRSPVNSSWDGCVAGIGKMCSSH